MNPRMNKAELLREKFARNEMVVGGHVFTCDSQITEAMGLHGFEFMWIDMEHTVFSLETVLHHLQAASSAGCAGIVRVPWNDPIRVKPVLEMGPDGIIFPMINTAEEARKAVAACTYPPGGIRGVGPRRAQQYNRLSLADYLADVDKTFLRIVQIEHIDAVRNLREILSVPGVDLAMIGPCDLSGSIGLLGQTRHPEVIKLYDEIQRVCREMGKPFGVSIGAGDEENIRDFIRRGVNMLGCGDDTSYISMGCERTFKLISDALGR
ncbi:MAG: aldolase/citrate lyase family protein [Clostridia bacterium]|nr:aldolase/citrate lyase family protein [Clostridia bacterium]